MIDNFLRRPRGVGEYGADGVRVAGVLSIIAAGIWGSVTDAGVLAFVLPGLVLPRFIGVRPWFDITFGVTLLVAAWSNVFDLYTRIWWWDIAVHFVCTGVLAAMLYLLLARFKIVADPDRIHFTVAGVVVMTSVIGLSVSALWEMVEWVGYTLITDSIFVEYNDTIADMAIGGLGAVAAGFVLAWVPLWRQEDPAE